MNHWCPGVMPGDIGPMTLQQLLGVFEFIARNAKES